MSNKIARALRELGDGGLETVTLRLLDIVPGRVRRNVQRDGEAAESLLRGMANEVAHRDWVNSVIGRLAARGLSPEQVVDILNQLVIALHRSNTLETQRMVVALEWLRRGPVRDVESLLEIGEVLAGTAGGRNNAISFFSWLFHRLSDEDVPVKLQALRDFVPGFSPAHADSITEFVQLFRRARELESWFNKGQLFELVCERFGAHESFRNFNTVNTTREVGARWRYAGANYTNPKNFRVFDLLIDHGGAYRFASVADGGLPYLVDKLSILVNRGTKDARKWEEAVEDLIYLASTSQLPQQLQPLGALTIEQASREVMRNARLLVPTGSVQPLRAVVASLPDFGELVAAFREATGGDAHALLNIIQPGL